MRIGFTTKATNKGISDYQNWGMGFLLVFFPEEDSASTGAGTGTAIINKKKSQSNHPGVLSSSPSSSASSPSSNKSTINALFKRNNSVHLLSRAQSTISICALLIFITLLLFTLSTFEPSTSHNNFPSRRQLVSRQVLFSNNNNNAHFVGKYNNHFPAVGYAYSSVLSRALQGMGTLYRRGTRAMNDLIVAHLVESLTVHDLKLFLRVFHSSNLASRSDLLFIFPSKSKSASFDTAILEENDSFLKQIDHYRELGFLNSTTGGFDVNQFLKHGDRDGETWPEPIWGRRIRSNSSEGGNDNNSTESTRLSYGSVVGFDVDELDPENSLAGFLDHVPMSLRRWACYPMLLGRVRRNFKHIMLLDAKEMLLFGDPLNRVRSMSPESVYLSTAAAAVTHPTSTRHGKKNSEKTQSTHSKSVNPTIITGGARGVRRLSSAMLTEIARATMQHKKKNAVSESGLFNQLVGNEFLLKNIKLITSKEPIPELSSLRGSISKPGSKLTVVRRGNSNFDVNSTVVKNMLCSDSSFYNSHC